MTETNLRANLESMKAQQEILNQFVTAQKIELDKFIKRQESMVVVGLNDIERKTFFGGIQYGFKKLLRK